MRLKYSYNTVESFLKEYVKDYKILASGELAINSPFMSDTTYDCHINVEKGAWHDFESDEHGNIEQLAAVILETEDLEEARRILFKYGFGDIQIENPRPTQPQILETKEIKLPPNCLAFSRKEKRGSLRNLQLAQGFLLEKLVNYKLAAKYNLLWTETSYIDSAKDPAKKYNLSRRIIIPTYEDGCLVYFQARDYTGRSELRYKNPPKEVQLKSIIVPFYDLILPNEILFISEGPWEAIQYSGTYMLGPVISDRQIFKIKKKNPKAIYFVPDNDETGRRKLIKNLSHIKSFMNCPIYIVKWWKGDYANFKDPIDAKIKFDDLINADFIEFDKYTDLRIKMGTI
jgi:hypothetical protein